MGRMRNLDILYLSKNRLEFTKATFEALLNNTDWSQVKRFIWYDDGSTDGTAAYAYSARERVPVQTELYCTEFGHPVAIMNDYLRGDPADMFVKVDNDTLLPPQWLTEGLRVMDRTPQLGLLGIEAFSKPVAGRYFRSYDPCRHIGGIGFIRKSAFAYGLPSPYGQRYGFTEWQESQGIVLKGWLKPALPVVLLDRVADEPWATLSQHYIAMGWQRHWPPYIETDFPWQVIQEGALKQYERCVIREVESA